MEYFWWLYLATRLDAIREGFGAMIPVSVAFLFVASMITLVTSSSSESFSKHWKVWASYRYFAIFLIVISLLGVTLVPSKKDAMFIAGGVGVVEGAKAIAGSEIAKKSSAVIEQWLENNFQELKLKAPQKK